MCLDDRGSAGLVQQKDTFGALASMPERSIVAFRSAKGDYDFDTCEARNLNRARKSDSFRHFLLKHARITIALATEVLRTKRFGKQFVKAIRDRGRAVTHRENLGVRPEFVDHLATGTAGRRGLGCRCEYDDRSDYQGRSTFEHRLKDRVALGTDRQAIRCVLDVAAREDLTASGKHGGANPKPAVRAVSVCRSVARRGDHCQPVCLVDLHSGVLDG